jgi:hypothetical protein
MSHKRTVEKHIISVKNQIVPSSMTKSTLLTGLYPGLMSNFRVCGTLLPDTAQTYVIHCWALLIHRHGQTVPNFSFPSDATDEAKNVYPDEEAVILFGYGMVYKFNTKPGNYNGRHYDVCSRTKRNLYREDALVLGYENKQGNTSIYFAVQFFVEY